jgi:hypothetical protein
MPEKTGYSAEARRQRKSRPPLRPVNAEVGMCEARYLLTHFFSWLGRGDYDMVVAMYHDQGHGPIKVLGWRPA